MGKMWEKDFPYNSQVIVFYIKSNMGKTLEKDVPYNSQVIDNLRHTSNMGKTWEKLIPRFAPIKYI